jgi:putative transposase
LTRTVTVSTVLSVPKNATTADAPETTHRVVEVAWRPRSSMQWAAFTASRLANAALWNAMVRLHARIRRLRWKWPSLSRWQTWAKGKFPAMSAQSVQQTVKEFCENIAATTAKRKAQKKRGEEVTAEYPRKTPRYRDVTYTNQTALIRDGFVCLGHGGGRWSPKLLRIRLPFALPGRLMEVTLSFGVVRIVCEVPVAPPPESGTVIGVDLGVNSLIAATDGKTAIVVSGREAKAIVQYRNKQFASAESKLSRCKQGSRRQKKLARRKHKMLAKCGRKIKDITHKATAAVARAFPGARAYVGEPFNDAAAKMNRRTAQQVSQVCTGKIIAQLGYKMAGVERVCEAYSSQACPSCVNRQKCRRVYRCRNPQCGIVAPRDVVGSANIRGIGLNGQLLPNQPMPSTIVFVRPLRKYRGGGSPPPRSSGGTPASSSSAA